MAEFELKPVNDVSALVSDWRSLYARASGTGFFLSPAWIETWLSGAPQNLTLYRLEGAENGELQLLGVFSDAPQRPPFLGLKETWFHEFGDRARDAVYVEYNDFLVAKSASSDFREQAIKFLFEERPSRDVYVFRNLTFDMAKAVRSVSKTFDYFIRILLEQPVYAIDLGGAFSEGLSKSLRTKVSRAKRLYNERGVLSGRIITDGEDWSVVWEKMTSLHAEGWRARGKKSVFDNAHLLAFHERLRKMSPQNVHLFETKAGDQTIGVLYNFIHDGRVMNYQSGFLFEDDNRLTPGFVTHMLAAEHYRDEGYKTYDLLAGEADYKKRLGDESVTLTSLVVERSTWRNRLRRAVKR